jgi:alpha/beta hydrolase fold
MDAVGSERGAILGASFGGRMAPLFAALYPERTVALVLVGTTARGQRHPFAGEDAAAAFAANWGRPAIADVMAPGEDAAFATWLAKFCRLGNPPKPATAVFLAYRQTDIGPVLPTIKAPTLVVQRTEDPLVSVEQGRYLAAQIPGARYVELPGRVHLPFLGDADAILREIETFLTGAHTPTDVDRVLRTVLFTDIVNSTARLADVGDRRWRELLDAHDTAVRRAVEQFRWHRREHCRRRLPGRLRWTGAGDPVRRGDRRFGTVARHGGTGRAVTPASVRRVATISPASPCTSGRGSWRSPAVGRCSSRPRDLVAGSGIAFADRGQHELKGVPGTWQVLAVQV